MYKVKRDCFNERKKNLFGIGISYLKHFARGKTTHGIHSPFVYNLLKDCIYIKTPLKEFENIEKQRKRLKIDSRVIEINDFGSCKNSDNGFVNRRQRIKDIARGSLKSPGEAALLCRLISYFKCDNILELGTCFGITTAYLAQARPGATIYALEGCPQTAEIAKNVFNTLNLKNIRLHIGEVDRLLIPVLKAMEHAPGLVFMDANHTKNATLRYFNILTKFINENSIVVIDDIHWSEGMEHAWTEICKHPDVTVTIDLFHMGLVFFRKGLSRENFLIRF